MDRISSWLGAGGDFAVDAAEAIAGFFKENPAPGFTLLGAVIAVLTARFVHFDRAKREHNDRVRKLLGEYVAAVHTRADARTILERRERQLRNATDPMDFVRQLKGQKPDPSRIALESKVLDAKESITAAESRIASVFFQISIVRGPGEDDLVYAAKLLDAANDDDDSYMNAYDFALAVAARHFNDGKHGRREAKRDLKTLRKKVDADWERYTANRSIIAGVSPGDSESPSGAGHHGTDNESTSETQGGDNGSRDHDEPGSPPGDRQ